MTSGGDPVAAKSAVRARLLARRRARTAADRAAAAAALSAALLEGLAGAATVAAYAPEETEPGFGRLPDDCARAGVRVLLPVVPGGGHDLSWAVHTGRLAPGRSACWSPTASAWTRPPWRPPTSSCSGARGLAGRRPVGRGGGFYDRALRHARPGAVLVALVFDDEFVDDLPTEAHDRRVTAVVTPSGGWQELPGGSLTSS